MAVLLPPLLPLLLLLVLPGVGLARGAEVTDPTAELAQLYAENGTWSQAGVVRLAAAIRRAAAGPPLACVGHACPATQDVQCATAADLVPADGLDTMQTLCPALLHQSQAPGCLDRIAQRLPVHKRGKPNPLEVWGYGMLFVTVISLSSIFAVLLLPLLGRACFERLMPGLIGLAVGSLTSSALFHLIPQAFDLVVEGGGHEYLSTALYVLAGAWFFFMLERGMKISLDFKKRRVARRRNLLPAGTLTPPPAPEDPSTGSCNSPSGGDTAFSLTSPTDVAVVCQSHQEPVRAMFGQVEEKPHSHHHHDHEIQFKSDSTASPIAVVAWMIIFGDGFHNFLDGLSIGAAFSESILTGISISLAVLCEELPHELGDFAVLLDAGMTVRQAVVYNFLSACTCYVGLVIGIVIGDFTESTSFVFALAAGMFLYISLVDMVPEMNEAAEKASGVGVLAGLRVLLMQNIGIMVGCFSLFSLAYFQDSLAFN